MKKYRTWYDARIEEVEVIRETASYVTLANNQRWRKRSEDHYNFFPAWAEAKAFLIDREKSAIVDLLRQIAKHEKRLKEIEEMQA